MTGLRRDAGAGEKLFERDKFIALRAEHVNDSEVQHLRWYHTDRAKRTMSPVLTFSIIWCATSSLLRTLQSIVSSVQKMRGNGDGAF